MPFKIRLLIFASLLFSVKGFAGPLPMKHFTMENGLPSNTAFYLFFDSKGYMWVPSDKGLARYNGKEFKKFTINDGLPDNEVFGVSEDNEERVWINTLKGVLCYYKDNTFHTATNTPWLRLKGIKVPSFFNQMILQKDSSLLTISYDGCFLLAIKGETLKTIPINTLWSKGILNDPAIQAIKLSKNRYQVFYNHCSYIIDTLAHKLKTIVYKDTFQYVGCLSPHKQYLASKKGIYTLDMQLILSRKLDIINKTASIPAAIQDKDHFFLGIHNGLLHNKDQVFLKGSHITALDYDKLGNLWIATLENGVFCLSKDFESICAMPLHSKIIASNGSNNLFYFITENGNFYNAQNFSRLDSFSLSVRDNSGKLFTKSTFCLSKNGDMLLGHSYDFYYKKKNAGKFRRTFIKSSVNLGYPVKSIHSFNGQFYIAYRGSLLIVPARDFEKEDTLDANKFLIYKTDNINRIYCSAVNETDSSFWFSTLNEMFSSKKGILTRHRQFNDHTLRQFNFYGSYLVGSTDDNKFFLYNTKSNILDSLPNHNCVWENIYPIDDHTAIINTDNYYKRLTLFPAGKDGRVKYKLENLSNQFLPNQADYIFGSNNIYYFQRDGELTGIPADILFRKTTGPQALIVSLKTEKANYPIKGIIKISYNEAKTINILIDVVDYNNMDHVTEYSISKDGSSDKWNAITGDEINFNEAGYGKYLIKLRSKTISGTFSAPVSLILIIEKPFWARWWFVLLCVLTFLLITYFVIKLIATQQIRKRQSIHDAEMKFQQSEYKALNALMNPHFIFNSLNNIQSLINRNNGETANQYLVIFSKLIRQNMLNISKGFVSLHKELELVENYLNLERLRYKDFINFNIEVVDEIDTEGIMISPLLIQPLVENAIIHGLLPKQSAGSMLIVKVSEADNNLLIEVMDNGIGITNSLRSKNGERESYGLTNLRRRIDHLKKIQNREIEFNVKEILDSNKQVSGTIASISIKFTASDKI